MTESTLRDRLTAVELRLDRIEGAVITLSTHVDEMFARVAQVLDRAIQERTKHAIESARERLKTVTYEELLQFVRRIASFKDLPSGLDPSLIPGIVGWASGIVQAADAPAQPEENNDLVTNKNKDAPPREPSDGEFK